MRQRRHQILSDERLIAKGELVGVIGETSFLTSEQKTPGLQLQYLGGVRQQQKSILTDHLVLRLGAFHAFSGGKLFQPGGGPQAPGRYRQTAFADKLAYRTKTKIASDLYDPARANGLRFGSLAFAKSWRRKPPMLRAEEIPPPLRVGAIHNDSPGRLTAAPAARASARQPSRPKRKMARLIPGIGGARWVQQSAQPHAALRAPPWEPRRRKADERGLSSGALAAQSCTSQTSGPNERRYSNSFSAGPLVANRTMRAMLRRARGTRKALRTYRSLSASYTRHSYKLNAIQVRVVLLQLVVGAMPG
jgi:hypothetical protein